MGFPVALLVPEPFLTHTRLVKQTGGRCLFAVIVLAWHPAPSLIVENGTESTNFPPEFFPAVKEGVEAVLSADTCARVILVDGLSHDVDSSPLSFRIAGKMAAQEAARCLNFSPQATSDNPREIAVRWEQAQTFCIRKVKDALSDELQGFQYHPEREMWWRESSSLEQLIRIGKNTNLVPTTLDLHFAFSVPKVLELLGAEDWRRGSGGLPQEIGKKRLSTLVGAAPFSLHQSTGPTLLEALKKHGLSYLNTYTQPGALLSLDTYLDAGTHTAIHYICGEKELARQKASQGLKTASGDSRVIRACEKILELL